MNSEWLIVISLSNQNVILNLSLQDKVIKEDKIFVH